MVRISKKVNTHLQKIVVLGTTLLLVIGSYSHVSFAQTSEVERIEQSIEQRNQQREKLEEEAARLRAELAKVGTEKNSLSKELSVIAAERKELENQIAQTQNSINTIDLEIDRAQSLISTYSRKIQSNTTALEQIIRSVAQTDTLTTFEILLKSDKLSNVFVARDGYMRLQEPLIDVTKTLAQNKEYVYENARKLASKQVDLSTEQEILDDQKSIVAEQEAKKDAVLKQTQNKESQYQKNLNATLAMIQKLDAEVRSFESTLKFLLDPSKLPDKGSAVFAWPLDYVLITQRFGKTVSSERLYVSGSHSGMDFRAATGTPVYAVADGVVKGVGDTDVTCPRASFGKWVFIEHTGTGLSTTSGHLSAIKVTEGQTVRKGDIIAYSGNTGRSTAPHLHLTVYATEGVGGDEGVRVTNRPSAACTGSTYRMPLAPTAAYLDPLSYFPPTTVSMFKHTSLAL